MVLDIVCGMEIGAKTAKWKSEYKGKTYYFRRRAPNETHSFEGVLSEEQVYMEILKAVNPEARAISIVPPCSASIQ